MILGFDPRYQFVHEDDVVHALEHAVQNRTPGVFNVAGDGVLALSEVAGLLGKPYAPVLPPWGTGIAAAVLRRVGIRIPPEAMNQLRYGRGVDNRRYKACRLPLPAHEPRGGPEARRAHAPAPGRARRAGALPLRARGRGVPALEPARQALGQQARRPRSAATRSPSSSACWRASRTRTTAVRARRSGSPPPRSAPARPSRPPRKATERAKKAERRAAEAALKATERAKKAERRARQAAEDAVERASRAAQAPAAAGAPRRRGRSTTTTSSRPRR